MAAKAVAGALTPPDSPRTCLSPGCSVIEPPRL
jgi:hypothetical protein